MKYSFAKNIHVQSKAMFNSEMRSFFVCLFSCCLLLHCEITVLLLKGVILKGTFIGLLSVAE